mgnify:FL=1
MKCTDSSLNREYILDKSKVILKSYNKLYNESFENNITDFKKDIKKMYDEDIQDEFNEIYSNNFLNIVYETRDRMYNIWKNVTLSDLGNKSVVEFFNDINDLDLLIEIFQVSAIECDHDIPDVLLQKLYSFGEQAIEKIIASMLNEGFLPYDIREHDAPHSDVPECETCEDSFLIPLLAIRILGEWKVEKAVQPIIDFLTKFPDTSRQHVEDIKFEQVDLFGETARDALISVGKASILPLLKVLTNATEYSEIHEYLAIALSEIGKDYKSDEIYLCLKKMFMNHHNKMVTSECLKKYGDGRAIPALRGYLERNINNIDNDTLYTFKLAIEKLGGDIDDILKKY